MTVIFFWTFIFVVTGLGALALLVAVWIRAIIRPNWIRARETYGSPQEHGFPAETLTLPGRVQGWWARSPNPDAKLAVLLVHGRSRRAGWMYPYAKRLWPDSTIMAIDLPGHGESRYALVSYGVREAKTISDAVKWLSENQPLPIVIIGVSMGGASAILAQAKRPSDRVCGLITIGAYTDVASVFERVAHNSGLSWTLTRPVFQLAGVIAGFDLVSHRPIDRVAQLRVPYLALQGTRDKLVRKSSARDFVEVGGRANFRCAYYEGPHDDPDNEEAGELIDAFIAERLRELSGAGTQETR